MTIYLILYSIFFVFAVYNVFISERRNSVTLVQMFILGILIIVTAGVRWDTGTDWANYRYFHRVIEQRPWGNSGMELGYELIVRLFKMFISYDLTPFLFFCAAFIVSFTYYTVSRLSPFPLFSLFLLLSYSLVASGFGVRQDLAISLTLFSVLFIKERKIWPFLFLVGIASLIHNSSLVFFPAYWIYKFKWSTAKVLIISGVVLACIFLSERIMQTFGSLLAQRKAMLYLENGLETFENPYVTLLKGMAGRALFLVVCSLFVTYNYDSKTTDEVDSKGHEFYNGLFSIYAFGIIIFLIFSPISLIFSRLARPYDIFQIILIPVAYYYAKKSFKNRHIPGSCRIFYVEVLYHYEQC